MELAIVLGYCWGHGFEPHAYININNVKYAHLVILTDHQGNPIGVSKPCGLKFPDILREFTSILKGGVTPPFFSLAWASQTCSTWWLAPCCSLLQESMSASIPASVHLCQCASQAEVVYSAHHPPLGFVYGLTLLSAAFEVSPDGRILLNGPHRPGDGGEGDWHHWLWYLSRGLALDYLSHVLGHVRVAEEFIVLPIIKMKVRTIFTNLLRLIVGVLGWPSDGGLITRAFP
jgi:hypothetical protein